ncbi:MAG: hypothetical protein J6S14_18970 [Clostridia bacterium]|nr:hypothetical protein [Clostridia bacterium]
MQKKVYNVYQENKRKGCTVSKLYKTKGMCTFIKMEYLVANALVELYENKKIDRISLDDVQNYGIKVEKILNKITGTQAILLYSNQYTREFLQDYSDYFVFEENYIKIKSGVSIDDIRNHILSYISVDILLALLDESTLKVINAA